MLQKVTKYETGITVFQVRLQPIVLGIKDGEYKDLVDRAKEEYLVRYRPGPRMLVVYKPNTIISHSTDQGWPLLSDYIRNPFSHKQYGNEKALLLYKEHAYAKPQVLMDIVRLENRFLACTCRHKRCFGQVLVEILSDLQSRGAACLIETVHHSSNRICFSFFGHKNQVQIRSTEALSRTPPSSIQIETIQSYNDFQLYQLEAISLHKKR